MMEPTAVNEDVIEHSFSTSEAPRGTGRARLSWANGALAFVDAPHAWMLKELLIRYPDEEGVDWPYLPAIDPETNERSELKLMSKYVLSSPEVSGILIMALAHNPKGSAGRERYLMSRAGTVVRSHKVMLPGVSVIEVGRTKHALTAEGTEQQLYVITVDGRDDVVKWKLGLLSANKHMSGNQKALHQCTGYDPDGDYPSYSPDWANGAIVLVEQGGLEGAKHIIKSNKIPLRKGDIVVSTAFSDLVKTLLRTELQDFVWMYTIKGNLRYRIEKLGIEDGNELQTEEQRMLCEVADRQVDTLRRWEDVMGKPEVPHGWAVVMTEGDLDALPTNEAAAASAIRAWTHPYACPKCGLAYMKWGQCYAHMGNCMACRDLVAEYSQEELQVLSRVSEARAEGSVADLFNTVNAAVQTEQTPSASSHRLADPEEPTIMIPQPMTLEELQPENETTPASEDGEFTEQEQPWRNEDFDLSGLEVGVKVHVQAWDSEWYLSEVLEVGDNAVKILYAGSRTRPSGNEEWVHPERIRSRRLRSAPRARPARDRGTWVPVGSRADNRVLQ